LVQRLSEEQAASETLLEALKEVTCGIAIQCNALICISMTAQLTTVLAAHNTDIIASAGPDAERSSQGRHGGA
jgi:hypothetical protein